MKTATQVLHFALLALAVTTFAHARPGAAPAAARSAVNPQPLPPMHDGRVRTAVNPQPLPPIHDGRVSTAINPQPLPPRDSRPMPSTATGKSYIGDTEKN